jgi:hypothetical protein
VYPKEIQKKIDDNVLDYCAAKGLTPEGKRMKLPTVFKLKRWWGKKRNKGVKNGLDK